MSVNYKVIARINPRAPTAPAKYYAQVKSKSTTDLEKLSLLLADGSTIRKADVYAVVIGLIEVMKKELSEGRMVKLGSLGSFAIEVNSKGVDSPDNVSANNIIRCKLRYRASLDLKTMLVGLKFKKIN